MSDVAVPLVVVPVNENIPPADKAAPTEPASAAAAVPPAPPRRGRWFPMFCALLAIAAAIIALMAPGLRPPVAALADDWLGTDNVVSRMVSPPTAAIERGTATAALDGRLAEYTARLDRLAAAQLATAAEVTRAVGDLRADHAASQALVRAVDDLTRQSAALQAAITATDARARASGLLALALRLRRDVDAGLPLDRDLAALGAAGPYSPAVDRALQRLHSTGDGAPTMRDLGDELDRLIAQIAARAGASTSWARSGWNRVAGLFGGATPAGNARLVEQLRTLAADGRFSEAANELETSDDADLGANWAARVRVRANAVLAAQALLAYSIAAYENAMASTGTR